MDNKLINIALASVFFEQQKNFLETYFPFVLKAFQSHSILNLKQIKESIDLTFGMNLPYQTIKGILEKNKTNTFQIKKISKQDWQISLSEKGKIELAAIIENEATQNDKLNIFYQSFIDYVAESSGHLYDYDIVQQLIKEFIINNLIDLSIKGVNNQHNDKNSDLLTFEKSFVNFLLHIKRFSPHNTETFDNLWKGTIIWNELKKDGLNENDSKFNKRIALYIDSNIILSLLGFHNEIITESVRELFELIRQTNNFDLYVLDITLEEVHELFDVYLNIKDNFSEIEVDTVFYYLKKQGYNGVKTEKLKDDLPEILKTKFNIERIEIIDWNATELDRYSIIYNHLIDIRQLRNEKLPEKVRRNFNVIDKRAHHDASAINYAIHCKDKYASNWEKVKAAFLTGSFWLFVDYKKISTRFESIPSVILDSTLTNILYLKSPDANLGISIDQVVKLHCNYLIVDKDVWIQFKQTIKELRDDDTISAEDHARLVSKNQITERYLLDVSDESLTRDDVLSILEKIKIEEAAKVEEIKIKGETIDSLTNKKSELEQKVILSNKAEEQLRKENENLNSKTNDLEGKLNKVISDKNKSSEENERLINLLKKKRLEELLIEYDSNLDVAFKPIIKDYSDMQNKTTINVSFLVIGLIISSVIISMLLDHFTNNKSYNWLKHIGYLVPNLVTIIVCFINWAEYKKAVSYILSKRIRTKQINNLKIEFAIEHEKMNPKPQIKDIII